MFNLPGASHRRSFRVSYLMTARDPRRQDDSVEMMRYCRSVLALAFLLMIPKVAFGDQPVAFDALGEQFGREIRPILDRHCMKCHAADVQEGTLDLEQFAKLEDVRRSTKTWLKVAEMLDNGEMPPKKAPQPSPEVRKRLRAWVADYLQAEALASAGDPGPVLLRRLNNAEYTYTMLDLTGVDLQPAREFPADGAAGEGFTNTGNALVMSPALLSKYLDAGKKIADHAVLLPDGIRFSPARPGGIGPTKCWRRIRGFYGRFTDAGGGTKVNLQGIVFGTNDGGRLPLEKYLRATIREREALATGTKSIAAVARQQNLNAKYLGTLWSTLTCWRSVARPRRNAGSLANRARRSGVGSLVGDCPLAEVALAIHQRRAHRQGWRSEGLDGAGHADRGTTRAAHEDARDRGRRRHDLPCGGRRRRRQRPRLRGLGTAAAGRAGTP